MELTARRFRTLIRKKYQDITWVSAKIEGTRLYIEVQERPEGRNIRRRRVRTSGCACRSDCFPDGVVVSITTRAGTPQVLAGDTVSEGDVLVSGTVELFR